MLCQAGLASPPGTASLASPGLALDQEVTGIQGKDFLVFFGLFFGPASPFFLLPNFHTLSSPFLDGNSSLFCPEQNLRVRL